MNSPSNHQQKVKVCYEQQLREIRIRRNRLRGILHDNMRGAKGRSPRRPSWRTPATGSPADTGPCSSCRTACSPARHGTSCRSCPPAPPTRPAPHHHAPPPRVGRRHIPSHAHYWARPPVPRWRIGALRAWEWIAAEWMIVVNGVYYYGDGYYYDGYNYYYNGAYHTAPPVSIYI